MNALKKAKSVIICFWCGVFLLFALGASPLWSSLRALGILGAFNAVQSADSVMEREGFSLSLPVIDGWFPLMNTFCDDKNFSHYIGEDASLTILYDFPAFTSSGHSALYDAKSPYYSSFYGAYVISVADGGFGLREGESIEKAASAVARYDYGNLVLRALGKEWFEQTFESKTQKITQNVSAAGIDGWTRIDAQLLTDGLAHERSVFSRSYLQYGAPDERCGTPFAPVTLRCATLARYFPEYDATVYLYAMTSDEALTNSVTDKLQNETEIQKT